MNGELEEDREENADGKRITHNGLEDTYRSAFKSQTESNAYTTLTISYYNLGVEYEHLQELPSALLAYQRGLAVALNHSGEEAPIVKTLSFTIEEVQKKINSKERLHYERKAIRNTNRISNLQQIGVILRQPSNQRSKRNNTTTYLSE